MLIQLLKRVIILLLFHVEVFDQIGHVVVIVVCSTGTGPLLSLLNCLVRFGKLAQRRERVGAKLVKDAGDELSELLDLPRTVDRKRIRRNRGVY
jgi:hypothetical protein